MPSEPPESAASSKHHSRTSTTSTASFLSYPVTYAVSSVWRRLSTDPDPTNPLSANRSSDGPNNVFSPPRRHMSPFQPPPLTPLTLRGYKTDTPASARLLSNALAEEIRLLIPPRLQLVERWTLAYSLEQNGVSLATLYKNCEEYRGTRGGFVLVIRDGDGGVGPYSSHERHSAKDMCVGFWCLSQRSSSSTITLLR